MTGDELLMLAEYSDVSSRVETCQRILRASVGMPRDDHIERHMMMAGRSRAEIEAILDPIWVARRIGLMSYSN
jgi:hypothetical protein